MNFVQSFFFFFFAYVLVCVFPNTKTMDFVQYLLSFFVGETDECCSVSLLLIFFLARKFPCGSASSVPESG